MTLIAVKVTNYSNQTITHNSCSSHNRYVSLHKQIPPYHAAENHRNHGCNA